MGVLMAVLMVALTMLLKFGYDFVSCYWLTPRRIKKIMEKQGVGGPKPRFLVGNIMEIGALVSKSTSQDMETIDHDIVGRLMPHFVVWSQIYGKQTCVCNLWSQMNVCIIECIFCYRKKIYFMEWNRAAVVPDGNRFN